MSFLDAWQNIFVAHGLILLSDSSRHSMFWISSPLDIPAIFAKESSALSKTISILSWGGFCQVHRTGSVDDYNFIGRTDVEYNKPSGKFAETYFKACSYLEYLVVGSGSFVSCVFRFVVFVLFY